MLFWSSMLFLLDTSSVISSSVMVTWSFLRMRVTSVFSLVSASTRRLLSWSISMDICFLHQRRQTTTTTTTKSRGTHQESAIKTPHQIRLTWWIPAPPPSRSDDAPCRGGIDSSRRPCVGRVAPPPCEPTSRIDKQLQWIELQFIIQDSRRFNAQFPVTTTNPAINPDRNTSINQSIDQWREIEIVYSFGFFVGGGQLFAFVLQATVFDFQLVEAAVEVGQLTLEIVVLVWMFGVSNRKIVAVRKRKKPTRRKKRRKKKKRRRKKEEENPAWSRERD